MRKVWEEGSNDKGRKGRREGKREEKTQRCYLKFVQRPGRKYRILEVRREGIEKQKLRKY